MLVYPKKPRGKELHIYPYSISETHYMGRKVTTPSIFLKMEDDLNFFQMEDDLNFVLGNLGSWFLVCNIVSTQLDEI